MKKHITITGIGIVVLVSVFFAWQYFAQTQNTPSQLHVIQDTKSNISGNYLGSDSVNKTIIDINADNIQKPVNKKIFGTNLPRLGRESWRKAENFESKELQDLFSEVSPKFVTVANAQLALPFYKESTGERSQRLSVIETLEKMNVENDEISKQLLDDVKSDEAYPGDEPPHKNYDDVLQFFEKSKIDPEISLRIPIIFIGQLSYEGMKLNLDPQTGADLVHYLNDDSSTELGRLRAENGHPEPYNVKSFVLGNELWSNHQFHFLTIDQITSQMNAFSKAMKRADPEIKIGINLVDDVYPKEYYDSRVVLEFEKLFGYNDKILSKVKDNIDFVTFHHYGYGVGAGEIAKLSTNGWKYTLAQNYFEEKYNISKRHKAIANKYGINDIGIAEFSGPPGTLGGAIYNTDYMVYLLNNDYSYATNHNSGLFEPHTYYGLIKVSEENDVPYVKNPNFYALKMFTNYFGDSIVQTNVVNSPTFETKALKWGGSDLLNWPDEEGIPSINAISSVKDNKLYLMVINRDIKKNIDINIVLNNFDPSFDIKVYTLSGPSIDADNSKNPNNVKITESVINTITDPFVYTFGKHSVTVFELTSN